MEPLDGLLLLGCLAVFYGGLRWLGRNERAIHRLTCPRTGRSAKVDVVQRYHQPERPVRVHDCDLLRRRGVVDCGESCLKQLTA